MLGMLLGVLPARAQDLRETNLWQPAEPAATNHAASELWLAPQVFRAFRLHHGTLHSKLALAPKEAQQSGMPTALISLPMPDGSLARFRFVESPVMAPELAAKFPEIKTYLGQGIDDQAARVRFDFTPAGFHAQILSPRGAVYVEPYLRDDTNVYAVFYKREYQPATQEFQCFTPGSDSGPTPHPAGGPLLVSAGSLRTYRLACAATAEYTQYFGGTVAAGLAAIVTAVNRVTAVYEAELGIRLVLVANNDLLVYTNRATEPYSNGDPSALLYQNQANLDTLIGDAGYDIGHVFGTAGGGLAAVAVVGVSGLKAEGETGISSPVGDAFYIDYVAHELGHQFGAFHSFNSSDGACGYGNRNGSSAYEPGSGSTIMSYAGICGSDNLQPHSDPYFHSASLDEIISYTTTGAGSSCGAVTSTGDSTPSVSGGSNFIIPMRTPFTLTATRSDAGSNEMTYCWEERDLGPPLGLTTSDNGLSPLFRSFLPTNSPARTFPRWSALLGGSTMPGEMLPATGRTMNFRVTVRANDAGIGGVSSSDMQVTVASNAGPFSVMAPAAGVTWSGAQTVSWNVGGTAGAPVNASNVTILLSTDGGLSFPIVLARNVPNTGTRSVLLPSLTASTARLMVQADGNVFFALSPGDFSIASYALQSMPPVLQAPLLSNGVAILTWSTLPGQSYRVQYKQDLTDSAWSNLAPDVIAGGLTATATDPLAAAERRFYRVLLLR
ncbi:Proprotein convertase P (fragment) [Verrucomicrobia bacterium]